MPLDEEQRIDADAISRSPTRATVRRHWSAEPDEVGVLVQDGPNWAMQSDGKQRLLRFHARSLRTGQPVSIVDANGAVLPFRVASIR